MNDSLFPQGDSKIKEVMDGLFYPLHNNGPAGIYIDGANVFHTVKALGFEVDFLKLKQLLETYVTVRSLNYFAAESESKAAQSLQGLIANNGYNVHIKNAVSKPYFEGKNPVVTFKKNVDTDMTAFAIDNAYSDKDIKQFILLSGDGDFIPAVKVLKRRGPVTVISTNVSEPPLVCRKLRRECNHFIDLADLRPLIEYTRPESRKG